MISLALIAIYPFASYFVGNMWLQDLHWSRTFGNLGRELFHAKRGESPAELEKWERTLLRQMSPEYGTGGIRTEEGVVRAVAWLTGSRRSPYSETKRLDLIDRLLRRAVGQQIEAIVDEPYGPGLGKLWRREFGKRTEFVTVLALRSFARAWGLHTLTQLGLIAAAALFLGALVGLCWWVVNELQASQSGRAVAADWTLIAGALVTFVSVVAVAAALTWRLGHALLALYPKPTTWIGRAAVAFVILMVVSPTIQFTFGVTHFDPNEVLSQSTVVSRVVGLVLFLLIFFVLEFLCIRYSARRTTRNGDPRRISLRVLAASVALFVLPFIPTFVLQYFSVQPSLVYRSIISILWYVAALGFVASLIIFLNECFEQWKELSALGVKMSRLGFRQWEAWVGLALTFGAFSLALALSYLSPNPIPPQVALVLNAAGALGSLWITIFGVLGLIFAFRVDSHMTRLRAERKVVAATYVPYERLLHEAWVELPLEAYVYGPEALIVEDGGDLRVGDGTPLVEIAAGAPDALITESTAIRRTGAVLAAIGLAAVGLATTLAVRRYRRN